MVSGSLEAVRSKMLRDIEDALANDEFHLQFQPVLDLAGGTAWGAEALLRWRHPDWDDLSPRIFVPAAEAVGMTSALAERVCELTCRQGVDWMLEGLPPLRFGVNISRRQLLSPRTPGAFARLLGATGLPASSLFIEIDEAALLPLRGENAAALDAFLSAGLNVAVDDFGAGIGSLALLEHPAVRMVKLAPALLRDAADGSQGSACVQAVSGYARARGLLVAAKGLETEGQMAAAVRHGVTLVQGYGVSAALAPDAFVRWCRALQAARSGG